MTIILNFYLWIASPQLWIAHHSRLRILQVRRDPSYCHRRHCGAERGRDAVLSGGFRRAACCEYFQASQFRVTDEEFSP